MFKTGSKIQTKQAKTAYVVLALSGFEYTLQRIVDGARVNLSLEFVHMNYARA